MRKHRIVLICLISATVIVACGVWTFNYFKADKPLQRVLAADTRNQVVKAQAHFSNWVDADTLIFDLTDVLPPATRMDVFRAFLQYAEAMKDRQFQKVILATRGTNKFALDGKYFQTLGTEYTMQNSIYTIRTFPIHLIAMDGSKPFPEYEGGLLGVLQKEMDQFTEFSDQWYVNTFQATASSLSRTSSPDSEAKFDPCKSLRDTDPHCGWTAHWESSGVSTNTIDGTKTEFLSIESGDADGVDFGKLHYAVLRICFKNGKLCGGQYVGIGVDVHGMVAPLSYQSEHSTPVRLKFDDEMPLGQTWGIADSNDSLFPYGQEKQFFAEVTRHNKLVLEFSYYEKAPRTVTFDISGLAEKMKSENLSMPKEIDQNQVFAKQAPQVSNPLFSAVPGSGRIGTGTTLGARFAAYALQMQQLVAQKWHTADVDARVQTAPIVIASFDLLRDGSIRNLRVMQQSGISALDYSAQRAILEASPFPPIPAGFDRDSTKVEFTFELKR